MRKILSFILMIIIAMSTVSIPGIAIAPGNAILLATYDFETGLQGWELYGTNPEQKVTLSTEDKFEGDYSVYIVDDSDTTTYGMSSPYVEVVPGKKYSFASKIRIKSGSSIRLYVKFYDNAGKLLLNSSNAVSGKYWQDICSIYEAPENAVKARMQLVGTSSEIGEAYVDYATIYDGIVTITKNEFPYIAPVQKDAVDASIVAPSEDKLVYKKYNEEGDTLSDFSYAGYYAGDIELPETEKLPVVTELSPSGTEDDTTLIQNAIDEAANIEGELKVVKLKAGKYYLPTPIRIKSGVLLSGEGQGPEGTILYASAASQYSPVLIEGTTPVDISAKKFYLTDNYVKSGSKTINVSKEDAASLKVGDEIAVYYMPTDEWCQAMDMVGVINVYENDTSWNEGDVYTITERTITAINGTEITVDFGFFVPYITELVPTYFVKMKDTGRVENAGIENLRIESFYNGELTDEEHATIAVIVKYAKNIFVRDITSKYFYFGTVQVNKRAKQVTIRNCSCLDPVSTLAGSRRYSFHASYSAQQVLFTGCYSYDGRHDYATSREVSGPIAFVDNVADSSNTSSETHGTWSTGVLYDNLYQIKNSTNGFIANANRGIYGTALSQGWTSAGCVVWNSLSPAIISHKPPLTYQNFIVGNWGTYTDSTGKSIKEKDLLSYQKIYRTGSSTVAKEGSFATSEDTSAIGDSYKESVNVPVNPRSLYKAQLSERYTGSYKNARPNAPILVYPMPDKATDESEVKITGIFEKGASKVIVYIDNIPYEATLNNIDNTFELVKVLETGHHKLYATQVIDGAEGNKTADRFITINNGNGNPSYLQSVYKVEETTMLLNDKRPAFNEYMEFKNVVFPEKNESVVNIFGGTVPEGDYLKVKNHTGHIAIRGNYSVVVTKLPALTGYKPIEYGMLVSKKAEDFTLETCDEIAKSKINLTGNYSYGMLLYNIKENEDYFVRSYAIYKDIMGKEHIMYGEIKNIKIINE